MLQSEPIVGRMAASAPVPVVSALTPMNPSSTSSSSSSASSSSSSSTSTSSSIRPPPDCPKGPSPWLLAGLSWLLVVTLLFSPRANSDNEGVAPSSRASTALRIGVEAAALPLISSTRRYTEEGHEVALARALGERLGVEPEFVALAPADFAAALAERRVDVVLTRADAATPALPSALASLPGGVKVLRTGYRSGVSAALRTDTALGDWADLAGRTVCASRGHPRAQALARLHGARLEVFEAPAQVLVALRTGSCDAALHDEAQLRTLFERDEWRKFSATLPAIAATDLVLVTGSTDAALGQALRQEAAAPTWQTRNATWAANVAFEVYFDQMGPDCH